MLMTFAAFSETEIHRTRKRELMEATTLTKTAAIAVGMRILNLDHQIAQDKTSTSIEKIASRQRVLLASLMVAALWGAGK
jgi:hypothetical protein